MDEQNLYAAPDAETVPLKGPAAGGPDVETLALMRGAAPWIRFIGIIGFVGAGFMAFLGAVVLFTGGGVTRELAEMGGTAAFSAFWMGLGWLGCLIYFAVAALTFFPALFAYRFGAYLKNYCRSLSQDALRMAFRNNKAYWQFNGILTIILVSLALFSIPLALVIIAASAL